VASSSLLRYSEGPQSTGPAAAPGSLTVPEPRHYRERRVKRLEDMCSAIQRVLGASDERGRVAAKNLQGARALAERFFLIHRTESPGAPALRTILSERRLSAKDPCTQRELDCGIDRAIYFFMGCVAYPSGSAAFLIPNRVLDGIQASYSPFDTGSLSNHARPRDPLVSWGAPEKHAFLESHLGDGADAFAFSAEYVAAHFQDVADYVRRSQQSDPDFPVYHDLASTTGDRRAWSIEVQLHEDLELTAEHLEAIAIADKELLVDIPKDFFDKLIIAEDEGSMIAKIQHHIVQEASS
jgi:hypothetical protein